MRLLGDGHSSVTFVTWLLVAASGSDAVFGTLSVCQELYVHQFILFTLRIRISYYVCLLVLSTYY
jgi:hypothetical protein